ncbi:TonB-dependent receptor plug domain-containing protein [Xanthomonas cerealis]|uniref:TonB-dependent receptor plug domain-containing protein n=1 Tax=Xanthomonas cerealis TaxID=3390025 RepID=UPI0005796C0C
MASLIRRTNTSVAVTTQGRIEQENLQNLYEVLNRTANVAQTYGDTGVTIRDIDIDIDAPLATVYLDGAALPPNAIGSAPLSCSRWRSCAGRSPRCRARTHWPAR